MSIVKIGRLLLAFGLACVAAYLAHTFVTMPYELITTTTVTTTPKPDGSGVMFLAMIFAAASLAAAFPGDWDR